MTASSLRVRRAVVASAGLGLVALAAAPSALADSYSHVQPTATSTAVAVAAPATSTASTAPAPALAVHHDDTGHLAYTGFETAGAVGLGVALVGGGALLVRSGRRRGQLPA